MNVKLVQKGTFDVIQSAVNKAVDMVRPTYGPSGNKVIIDKQTHKINVDDGVQIMRDLVLPDPSENAVLNIVRETAIRTNDRVGDGTTGAMIIVQAIINEVAKKTHFDGRKIEKEIRKGFEEAKEQLLKTAKPIKTREDLERVARISFDDEKIAKIIADVWFKLGKDGVVTVDKSGTMETVAEINEGISIDHGYISPYMVNNPARMECLIEKPYILFTDYRMTETSDILPLMNKLAAENKGGLVVIAENIEQNALATMIINLPHVMNPETQKPGTFSSVAIVAPSGENRKVALEDMAILTGGKVFTQAKGNRLEDATIADLGRADRIIVKRDSTVIISPKGDKKKVAAAIEAMREVVKNSTEREKPEAEKRLARFSNKVAVIKVGAVTENEQRALKYKVEDSVNATQAAFKGGVVCGSGLALARLTTSSDILNAALQRPFQQLKENVGLDEHKELKENEAINVVTGKTGEFMSVGVMDPVDVLVAGLESAVSIARMLLTTSGMVVELPKPAPREE